jgi:hypothetical protein
MNEQLAVEKLVMEIREYARGRASDVARGAETPQLAALMLQKYGLGVVRAVGIIFESPRAADPVMSVLDEETVKIDPEWRQHDRQRWESRPADLSIDSQTLR